MMQGSNRSRKYEASYLCMIEYSISLMAHTDENELGVSSWYISSVCLLGVRTSTDKLERKRYTEKESAGKKLRRILQRENHTS